MNELIKITTNEEGKKLVGARELHEFLENKRQFADWIKQRIEQYGFIENEDFTVHKFVNGKATQKDYVITVEMAKELSMVENNEKGKEARKYFIQCEKVLKEIKPQIQGLSPQLQLLINMELEQKQIKEQLNQVSSDIEANKKEVQAIRDVVTLDFNGWRKETTNIINAIAQKLGGFGHIQPIREESYKLLNERLGVDIGKRLLNKKKNMALEGVSKSKIDKVNKLDVIAEDKKLIDGYTNIIRQFAIKYGVA